MSKTFNSKHFSVVIIIKKKNWRLSFSLHLLWRRCWRGWVHSPLKRSVFHGDSRKAGKAQAVIKPDLSCVTRSWGKSNKGGACEELVVEAWRCRLWRWRCIRQVCLWDSSAKGRASKPQGKGMQPFLPLQPNRIPSEYGFQS